MYALVNNLGERQRNSKYGPEVFIDVVGDGRVPDITAEQQVKVCVYYFYIEIWIIFGFTGARDVFDQAGYDDECFVKSARIN